MVGQIDDFKIGSHVSALRFEASLNAAIDPQIAWIPAVVVIVHPGEEYFFREMFVKGRIGASTVDLTAEVHFP